MRSRPTMSDTFDGDIQAAKKALIKDGLKLGVLSRQHIQRALPLEHMSETELEMLLFTFDALGIRVIDEHAGPDES